MPDIQTRLHAEVERQLKRRNRGEMRPLLLISMTLNLSEAAAQSAIAVF